VSIVRTGTLLGPRVVTEARTKSQQVGCEAAAIAHEGCCASELVSNGVVMRAGVACFYSLLCFWLDRTLVKVRGTYRHHPAL